MTVCGIGNASKYAPYHGSSRRPDRRTVDVERVPAYRVNKGRKASVALKRHPASQNSAPRDQKAAHHEEDDNGQTPPAVQTEEGRLRPPGQRNVVAIEQRECGSDPDGIEVVVMTAILGGGGIGHGVSRGASSSADQPACNASPACSRSG